LPATPLVLVLNGPNLGMLGRRQPEIYGRATLADVERLCRTRARALGLALECRQSDAEHELIRWIHGARGRAAGIVINAGAYTHTSIALMDALAVAEVPAVEVHLSNVYRREAFRHVSYISKVALGVICGFGPTGYALALEALALHLAADRPARPNRKR
jgi:3-dehydroquinate dehydratase II